MSLVNLVLAFLFSAGAGFLIGYSYWGQQGGILLTGVVFIVLAVAMKGSSD